MEGSAFSQGLDEGEDPFGGGDGSEEFAADLDAEGAAALADSQTEAVLPEGDGDSGHKVVDREGNVVEPPDLDAAPPAAEAPPQDEAAAQAEVEVAAADAEQAPEETDEEREERELAEAGRVAARAAIEAEDGADPTPAADGDGSTSPTAEPTETQKTSAGETQAEARPTAAEAAKPTVGSDGQPLAARPAPKPRAPKAEGSKRGKAAEGKTHKRGYVILVPEGPDTFRRLSWKEDKYGNPAKDGKEVNVAMVKQREEALAIGWTVLGEPEEKVALMVIPELAFVINKVGPDKKPIRRTPLKIS